MVVRVMSYILKLPPTKNWRGILNVCVCESKIRRVGLKIDSVIVKLSMKRKSRRRSDDREER